jgi:hypothetical protein
MFREFVVEDVGESSAESVFLQGHLHENSRRLEQLDLLFVVGEGRVNDVVEDFSGLFVFGLAVGAGLINKLLVRNRR